MRKFDDTGLPLPIFSSRSPGRKSPARAAIKHAEDLALWTLSVIRWQANELGFGPVPPRRKLMFMSEADRCQGPGVVVESYDGCRG